jgi:gluconate 2-dehydrogenase gamma chain
VNDKKISRRHFVIDSCAGIGSAWLISNLPEILAAQDHAHKAALSSAPVKLEFFTPEQAEDVEAIAAQIIPTDATPGAREARVIYFIDRALATFLAGDRVAFLKGLKDLQSKVKKRFKKEKIERFSALTSDRQIMLLKSIDKSDFFELIRTMTIYGMFANPSYGGNHDEIGWKLIGFESRFGFEPPFGFYDGDDQANR